MFFLPALGLLIPIVAILMVFGTGMLAIFVNYRKRKHMFSLYHQERMAAIDKGVELPPLPEDFFREEGAPPRRSSQGHGTLLAGLILVFTGLSLYLALHFTIPRIPETGGDAALFALIPAGIGVACLLYYFAVGRKAAAAMEAERKARLAEATRSKNPPTQ
jgi:hypothetical protein